MMIFRTSLQRRDVLFTKTGTLQDTNNDNIHSAGDQVIYAFTVTNTGNVTLTNVTVSDVNPSVIISGSPIYLSLPDLR